jgi:hypothetical protein
MARNSASLPGTERADRHEASAATARLVKLAETLGQLHNPRDVAGG